MKKSFEHFLPFSRPTIDDNAINEVIDSLKSGWITTGPKVSKFEEMLRQYFDSPNAITVTSATAGLYIVLQALSFDPGDEIITTPMTFVSTINVIVMNNLKPVLVDINLEDYNIDVSKIEEKITNRTRAIMPVHFAGFSVDLDPVYALARKYNLRVIEDAAHAIGSYYKGRKIGTFGDIQVFSFHPNKNITTGEGGCIITRDDELSKKLVLLRFHGMDREAWNRFGKLGSQYYEILMPGHKFNMMDIQAALGIHQLPKVDEFNMRRNVLAQRYLDTLKGVKILKLPKNEQGHAWHLFAPLVNDNKRDKLMTSLKELNIGTGLHYQPVHLFQYYKQEFGWTNGTFPNAEQVGSSILSLPLFPLLQEEQQDIVISTLQTICEQV